MRVCGAPVCNDTFFVYGWRLIFSGVFFYFCISWCFAAGFTAISARKEKTKCNATHGKNMWFHFPWCIVNILQMKRYGLAHTWYKRWHTQLERGKERNVVHLCSCSYQLRWKFIVICDPRGRLLYMCIDWSERTHRIKFVITNFGNDDMLLLLFHSAVSSFGCRVIHRLRFNANWGGRNAINAFTDREKRESEKMARIDLNALQKCQRPQFNEDASRRQPA